MKLKRDRPVYRLILRSPYIIRVFKRTIVIYINVETTYL